MNMEGLRNGHQKVEISMTEFLRSFAWDANVGVQFQQLRKEACFKSSVDCWRDTRECGRVETSAKRSSAHLEGMI
jgi:hypothetical protein